ncbi:MAG: hypothetical protein IJM62_06450, partial [Lachnospiraceae bacterium]|nr:hypothetical protein [Lachnospiraceae bacterium]
AADGMTITAAAPDMADALTALKLYDLRDINTREEYPGDKAFSASVHSYTHTASDANSSLYMQATGTGGYTVKAVYNKQTTVESTNGAANEVTISSVVDPAKTGSVVAQFLAPCGYSNRLTVRLTKTVNGIEYYQDYDILFVRELHLKTLSATVNGDAVIFRNEAGSAVTYDRDIKDYYVNVTLQDEEMVFSATWMQNSDPPGCGYYIDVDDVIYEDPSLFSVNVQALEAGDIIPVKVCHEDENCGDSVYNIHINKVEPVEVSFVTDPGTATVFVKDTGSGKPVYDTDGIWYLFPGITYSYTVSAPGYLTKQETTTPEGPGTIEVALDPAPENPELVKFDAPWPFFRADQDNNGVVDYPVPTVAEEAMLYWAVQLGSGYSGTAAGCPILVGDYLYTYGSRKAPGEAVTRPVIYKINTITGEEEGYGLMDHASSFAINSPAYADGMMFVGLSNGCVQAFNAETMESVWIYRDELGGQPNCPIVYKDGYIYTGFWNAEDRVASFVCIPVTDEVPGEPLEEKKAAWTYTKKGGFYWAGACATDDYVIVGTDDGEAGFMKGHGHVLTFDPVSGKVLGDLELAEAGDIRSSMVRDPVDRNSFYFTTKGGYFYKVTVGENGSLSSDRLRRLKLYNYHDDPKNPAASTCSPVIYNGRAYFGVSGTGTFAAYTGHNITVVDLSTWRIAYTVRTQGYPQTSGLLTTYYSGDDGTVYVYFQDNFLPGKTRVLRDRPGQTEPDLTVQEDGYEAAYVLFTPYDAQSEYAICSAIADDYGTLYFKNDSAYMMAVGSTIEELEITHIPDKVAYDEGETFDPAGLRVTAVYTNGKTRDVTDYVTWSEEPLTEDDSEFAIRFEHVMYQDRDGEAGQEITPPTAYIHLTIGDEEEIWGDVDQDGRITDNDMDLVWAYVKGTGELTEEEIQTGDINGDGKLNMSDVLKYYRYLKGKIASLKP